MLLSTTAANNSLDADYGAQRAASMPATMYVHLGTGDPTNGGVELPQANGYTPLVAANNDANFPPAVSGSKKTADFVWTATAAWSEVATWAWLSDGAGNLYDGAALGVDLNVTGASTVKIRADIFYNELGD